MQIQITKWGNSLGVRLPRALAAHIGAREGEKAEITLEGERPVIERIKPAYNLEELVVNMTPEAMSEAFDWGEDKGRERVDD